MHGRTHTGFTLVEVPIALLVLLVGLLSVVGSAALVSRMVGRGRHTTTLAHTGAARMEWLRGVASATTPRCLASAFAGGQAVNGPILERWELEPAGDARRIALALERPEAGGVVRDTFRTAILCR